MKTNSIEQFKMGNQQYFLSAPNKSADIEIITTRKEKPAFDIHREITNRTFIRPLPPKGHIVESSILSAPGDFVDDIKTDITALKSALKGDANDHQLGKLNDLGMKLGGLTIATYLFSMRKAPITKAMEFVGFGAFFASMAIWPKIALDIPARLIHGFSPFMRYEDSQGRQKRFFTDNQYIPFDMLSDKKIHKIGDKLGIPTNQPNRRDAIQEKMRQIALQNNTMWMLTAGFATPILSSLMCYAIENPILLKYGIDSPVRWLQSKYLNGKVDKIMKNFAEESKKFETKDIIKNVEEILVLNNDKPITKDVIKDISNALCTQLGSNVKLGVQKDLELMFINDKFKISETQIKPIAARIESVLTAAAGNKILPQTLKCVIPTENQLSELFTNKGYFGKPLSNLEIKNIISEISTLVIENINTVNNTEGELIKPHMQIRLGSALGKAATETKAKTLENILTSRPAVILDEAAQNVIKQLAKTITTLGGEHTALHLYAYKKLAQAPDTAKAKYWNDTVNLIVDTLGISSKEIEKTRYDRKLVGELFNRKIWEFATSEPDKYKNFIEKLVKYISEIDTNVSPSTFQKDFITQAESTYTKAANALRDSGFTNTANRIIRKTKNTSVPKGAINPDEFSTVFGITKKFINGSLTNLSSTFAAILNKANVYRTIYKDPNLGFIGAQNLSKEVKEEIVALIEYLTTEGRISDYSVKFDFLRNLTPDETVGKLDITPNSGVKYSHYNPEKLSKNGVIIKSDVNFFRNVINALFSGSIEQDTNSVLSKTVEKMLTEYRENMREWVANIENFMYPEHIAKVEYKNGKISSYTTATPKMRSNAVGAPLDEVFTNVLRQKYNTSKWLKMFGGFGAGLLTLTVLSQFMFGRGGSGNYKKDKA